MRKKNAKEAGNVKAKHARELQLVDKLPSAKKIKKKAQRAKLLGKFKTGGSGMDLE